MTTSAKQPIVHPELSGILRLADPRFVLSFNPLTGPLPIRVPQPQPDPAPDVRGFAQHTSQGEATAEAVVFALGAPIILVAAIIWAVSPTSTSPGTHSGGGGVRG